MATIDLSKVTDRNQRKQYQRMSSAGKGDAPRNVWSRAFKENYDLIFKHDKRTTRSVD